jgi:hypothetical protein
MDMARRGTIALTMPEIMWDAYAVFAVNYDV